MPSSSRTCIRSACSGRTDTCLATRSAVSASTPWPRNTAASSRRSASGLCSSSYFSFETSALTSSFCEETETNSPVAIDSAPAASPARPVRIKACRCPPPPPTPAIREMLVTRPSIAPKTAGRSQPPETSRCLWPCASLRRSGPALLGVALRGVALLGVALLGVALLGGLARAWLGSPPAAPAVPALAESSAEVIVTCLISHPLAHRDRRLGMAEPDLTSWRVPRTRPAYARSYRCGPAAWQPDRIVRSPQRPGQVLVALYRNRCPIAVG